MCKSEVVDEGFSEEGCWEFEVPETLLRKVRRFGESWKERCSRGEATRG